MQLATPEAIEFRFYCIGIGACELCVVYIDYHLGSTVLLILVHMVYAAYIDYHLGSTVLLILVHMVYAAYIDYHLGSTVL